MFEAPTARCSRLCACSLSAGWRWSCSPLASPSQPQTRCDVRSPLCTSGLRFYLAKTSLRALQVTGLKLQEHGIAKETLAMIGVGVTPIALVLPALIARYTSGPQPLQPFMAAVPYRLLMNLAFSATVWFVAHSASSARDSADGGGGKPEISALNWAVILAAFGVQQVVMNVMFVSQMAFFAKVSEPRIGGTYMTLLNTIANLGAKWPSTLVFPLIDVAGVGGADGYHVTNLACTILGVAWYFGVRTVVKELSAVPSHKWWTQPRTKGEEMQALV
mmetsp:Transcript_53799/g.107901  ORF Transcript_53799/g.107901 Transcript_53799/m.107901 type:complete len:275 (+) Transcript_53799:997-1821(+)